MNAESIVPGAEPSADLDGYYEWAVLDDDGLPFLDGYTSRVSAENALTRIRERFTEDYRLGCRRVTYGPWTPCVPATPSDSEVTE